MQGHTGQRQRVVRCYIAPHHLAAAQIPELGRLVRRSAQEVHAIRGEGRIPDPALMLAEHPLGLPGRGRVQLDGLVGRGCGNELVVVGDEHLEQIVIMRLELLRQFDLLQRGGQSRKQGRSQG